MNNNDVYKPNLINAPVSIIGAKYVEFTNDQKELVRGITIWYLSAWEQKDKDKSIGKQAQKQWVTNIAKWEELKTKVCPFNATIQLDVVATDKPPKFYDIKF